MYILLIFILNIINYSFKGVKGWGVITPAFFIYYGKNEISKIRVSVICNS
jgi:hypothetical protein